MDNLLILDLIRGMHLICIVLGMGAAVYFDIRSMHRIMEPTTQNDLDELHRIHKIVSSACIGLWLSGMMLIGVRTGFDMSAFSPKLWSKVIVVTLLTANAMFLTVFVIPALTRFRGARLIDLPVRFLVPMTLCAGVSASCWLLALALGASQILKTASWELLVPVLLGSGAVCIGGVFVVIFGIRYVVYSDVQTGVPA